MPIIYSNLAPGYYRLARNICITSQIAICPYPLRILRLSPLAINLLLLCQEQHNAEQLAQKLNQSIHRIEALCEQMRWKGLLEAGPTIPPATWPNISIIIPTHNRLQQLERCLRSLLNLNYPSSSLEIIVVDDASTTKISTSLQLLTKEFEAQDTTLNIIRNSSKRGVAQSRNTGAEAAQYDLLAYIDSDCIASPGWLSELVPAFQNARIGAVGGRIRAYERQSLLGRYEDVHSSLFMGIRPQQVGLEGPLTYLPTANFLVRRALWQKLGGFAPLTFGEDVDFCRRLLSTGSQILYLPQGVVYHDYRTRLWPFLSIHASYASSEAALLQRHPSQRRILVLPPEQATFAGLVIGGIWGMIIALWYQSKSIIVERQQIGEGGGGWDRRRGGLPRPLWLPILIALLLILFGTRIRLQKVQKQLISISPFAIFKATIRGHLSYTYHLCRHLTRYYTLPLLLLGVLLPPLLLLVLILCSIVIGVDYVRLGPQMNLGQYALCSLLDDCSYEIGIITGCIKHKTWKSLLPIIKRSNPTR